MFNLKALFLRAMLALAMATGACAAVAGPIYQVSIDTSALAGTTGYLDFSYNGPADAGLGSARITKLVGNFLPETYMSEGTSGDVNSGIELVNQTGFNFFDQAVVFGGMFRFDVILAPLDVTNGIVFTIALFDARFSQYLGVDGNLLEISVMPDMPNEIFVAPDSDVPLDIVTVAAVPEPSDWLLLMTGLLLISFTRHMQPRR